MAKILVVEDDAHIMRVMCMWLSRTGYDVTEARDGKYAQEILESESFDLIVSDVNMPRMTGMELATWLRNEHGSNTPMIVLSSRSDQAELASCLDELGIQLHPKPFSPSRLKREADRLLGAVATDVDV